MLTARVVLVGGLSSSPPPRPPSTKTTSNSSNKVLISTLASSSSSSASSPSEQLQCPQFKYSRASPSVRWPHLNLREDPAENQMDSFSPPSRQTNEDSNPQISPTGALLETNGVEGSASPNLANDQQVLNEASILGRGRIAKKTLQTCPKEDQGLAATRSSPLQCHLQAPAEPICGRCA